MFVLVVCCVLTGCGAARLDAPPGRALDLLPAVTYVSRDGVRFEPGPERTADGLSEIGWREVQFADGKLRLGGFASCLLVDHVQIGPSDGNYRRVTVWGKRAESIGRCTREVSVQVGADWTQDTIAAPARITVPDPRRTEAQTTKGVAGTAVLQPDRRTVLISYGHGGCSAPAKADARLTGTTIAVAVTLGGDPAYDGACSEALFGGVTMARLPTAAPAAARVQVNP
jgi:hypothetical protein